MTFIPSTFAKGVKSPGPMPCRCSKSACRTKRAYSTPERVFVIVSRFFPPECANETIQRPSYCDMTLERYALRPMIVNESFGRIFLRSGNSCAQCVSTPPITCGNPRSPTTQMFMKHSPSLQTGGETHLQAQPDEPALRTRCVTGRFPPR